MTMRIVRLGTPRLPGEGLRLGTVRRLPRGVPKERYAEENWFDVWLPNLSPSQELVKEAQAGGTPKEWEKFVRHFIAEMNRAETKHLLDTFAKLSHTADFSIGCYCEDEDRCHRSVLRRLFVERGAKIA